MAPPKVPSQVPAGDQTVTVKLICPVRFGPAILSRFMAPPVPGMEKKGHSPSLSFLIEHPSGSRLVWDLGIRKDYQNYAPSIANYIPTTNYDIQVAKNVSEMLEEGGVPVSSINAVIWSHWHWDHIGDPSTFPSSTDLVVGPGFKQAMLPAFPTNPNSPLLESDFADRNLHEVTFEGPDIVNIGHFRAFDYFGDASFFLLDSPGHAVGHLCGLARTTTGPTPTFVLLGGDVCHYAAIFRPSKHMPVPVSITPHPFIDSSDIAFCPGGVFENLQRSRGREPTDSIFDMTFGHDIPLAMKTRDHLQEIDCDEDVFVIIAHDATVDGVVSHFPDSLNDWKEKGWGHATKWAFLKDFKCVWDSWGQGPDL